MPAHNTQSQYFSGQGVVLLATRNATTGEPEGFVTIGNVSALALAVATTNLEHKESTTGARGIDLRLTQEVNATVNMTIESLSQENLALGLYGTTTDVAQGTASEKTFASVKLGQIYSLDKIKVSTVSAEANPSGTPTTLTVNENFRVNEDAGSIYFMTAAEQTAAGAAETLTDEDEVKVTFDHAAQKQMDALTTGQPERWLRFEGLNTADGNKPVVIDVFRFAADPLQELAMINEELANIAVEGSALADQKRTTGSKYFRVQSLA